MTEAPIGKANTGEESFLIKEIIKHINRYKINP